MSAIVDTLQTQHQRGLQADEILRAAGGNCPECGAGTSLFIEREQQIVKEAIGWFRDASPNAALLDPQVAIRYIAALSEVRALREELEYRARKGGEARTRLLTGSENQPTVA